MTVVTGWWAETFVSLTGIPSSEAFGDLGIVPSAVDVHLTGVPSSEAFGNLMVIGPPQPIHLTGIPSSEAFGTLGVGRGPVSVALTGIPSSAAFGTLALSPGPVNVNLTGVPSSEAFGTLGVSLPIAFDVVGANAVGTAVPSLSMNTVIGSATDELVVYLVTTFATLGSTTRPSITVTCGGVAMVEKATIYLNNSDGTYLTWLTAFTLAAPKVSPGTGTKAIVATFGLNAYVGMQSISYKNASGVGTPVTAAGLGTALSIAATAATNVMLSQCFVAIGQTATRTGPGTPRYTQAFVSGSTPGGLIIAEAPGTGSPVTFTATATSARWAGIILPLTQGPA